jgi:hypothetical protein
MEVRMYTIALLEKYAQQLSELSKEQGVPPEALIQAWVADKLDYERVKLEKK